MGTLLWVEKIVRNIVNLMSERLPVYHSIVIDHQLYTYLRKG